MLDDKDEFERNHIVQAVMDRILSPYTALDLVAELKRLDSREGTEWLNFIAEMPHDLIGFGIKDLTQALRKRRIAEQDWHLTVGSFITW